MYQNAAPPHPYANRGGYPTGPSPAPQAGGYYDSGTLPAAPPPQGAAAAAGYPYGMSLSPVNAAYQRGGVAGAPMTARGPSPAIGGGEGRPRASSASRSASRWASSSSR